MWSGNARSINYGLTPEMGMVGLRDVFVVAPASSFHHNSHHQHQDPVMSDPHSINGGSNPGTALGVGVGVGVIPLLTAAPCLGPPNIGLENENILSNRNRGGGIQLWQEPQYLKKSGLLEHNTSSGNYVQGGGGGLSGSATTGGTTCQDCGNQAKKDCSHRRCRTCCKSRGFDCPTHVKSTWVAAARRRERQLMATAAVVAGSSGSASGAKKPRLVVSQTTTTSRTSTSNTTPPRSFETTSSHQDASFKQSLPGQIRAQAVFKCVRVTKMEDGQDEYAYQAVVKIGGHVFKGVLYDQGEESGRDGYPDLSELHLGGGSGGSGRNGASSSSPMLDPSEVYAAAAGGGLLGGSAYGNPIN